MKFPKRKYLFYYLTGFIDGEGSFSISVKRQAGTRFGWVLDPVFHVAQSEEHMEVLEMLRDAFQCGRIQDKHGSPGVKEFVVDNRRQLVEKVIPLLRKYKLIVKKERFELFAEIVESLERGEHRTKEGFKRLVSKVYSFKLGKGKSHRKYTLDEILTDLAESSEAIR